MNQWEDYWYLKPIEGQYKFFSWSELTRHRSVVPPQQLNSTGAEASTDGLLTPWSDLLHVENGIKSIERQADSTRFNDGGSIHEILALALLHTIGFNVTIYASTTA